ncbi:MAG: AEC family transporter [Polyangiaceae bacterium]
MANFALILLGLGSGYLFKRTGILPRTAAQAFNVVVIYLGLPALIFQVVPKLFGHSEAGAPLFIPLSMAWLSFGMAAALFGFLGKRRGWSRSTTGAMILMVGLGNTSFVGIPLLDALYGAESLPTILLVDQPGSFLCLATVASITASIFGGHKPSAWTIARKVLTFPPFIALILGLVAAFTLSPGARAPIDAVCAKLSPTVVPLSLLSVGLQLEVSVAILRRRAEHLVLGLGAKLVLLPLLLTALYVGALKSTAFSTKITLLEGAMAPMITGAILVTESRLDEEIGALMIGVGIPISLATVPVWDWVLSHVVMR